jgi:hypothetical protein
MATGSSGARSKSGVRATAALEDIWLDLFCCSVTAAFGMIAQNTGRATMSDISSQTPKGSRLPRAASSVTATQLGEHLDLTRQRVGVLADVDHVLERQADGRFDLDASRIRYIRHLRSERARSPNAAAAAALALAKAETLQLKLMQQKRELVSKADFDAMIDEFAGVTLTTLSSLPARCAPRGDLATRRAIERVVFEVRTEIAKVCQEMADRCGEPSLDEQDRR